jgi:hypothetical protein
MYYNLILILHEVGALQNMKLSINKIEVMSFSLKTNILISVAAPRMKCRIIQGLKQGGSSMVAFRPLVIAFPLFIQSTY